MAQEIINVGEANQKQGDTPYVFCPKINRNFTELYENVFTDTRKIPICSEDEFPIQDATSITLESGFEYDIQCPITSTKYFKCEGGNLIGITTVGDFYVYTGTGDMFDCSETRIGVRNITLSCPNANVFKVTGDGSKGFDSRAVVSDVTINSCTGFIEVADGAIINFNNVNAVGTFATSPVKTTGTGAALQSIKNVAIVGAQSGVALIDLGSAVHDEVELANVITISDAGAHFVSGLIDSGNISVGGSLAVNDCNMASLTNPLLGVTENDTRSQFGAGNSANLRISQNAGDLFLDGASETVAALQNEWHEIGIPSGGGSWAGDISDRFTINSAGYIEYTGEREIDVRLTARATVEKVGGGSDEIECRIAKNWTGATTDGGFTKSRASTQNNTPTAVPMGCLTTAVQGDNFRVIFENKDSSSDIIASVTSLEVRG